MKMRWLGGPVALALVLNLFFLGSCGAAPQTKEAQDFTLSTPEGRTVTLSEYKGKKNVIVMFWKTSGLYCPFELNNLKERYPGLQKEGFEVLAVDKKEAAAKVAGYAEKEGLPFPVLLDEDGKVSDIYDVGSVPVFLIVNKEGAITWRGYRFPERYAELAGS